MVYIAQTSALLLLLLLLLTGLLPFCGGGGSGGGLGGSGCGGGGDGLRGERRSWLSLCGYCIVRWLVHVPSSLSWFAFGVVACGRRGVLNGVC